MCYAPPAVATTARWTTFRRLSRGSLRTIYLCPTCDAEVLRRHLDSDSPVPFHESTAAGLR